MSIFDNHADVNVLNKEGDKIIREFYRISNSGSSLIPKKGLWALKSRKYPSFGSFHAPKLPEGVLREESSIFNSLYGLLIKYNICSVNSDKTQAYDVFKDVIRNAGLQIMIYNNKRYYSANRDAKNRIMMQMKKIFNK